MPLVRRALTDMFILAPYVDVMINPVNLTGVMGKGIALEFKNRHPEMYLRYKQHCTQGDLHVGKIHTYYDPTTRYIIVNLPTKRHYADASDPEDIKRGLHALRRWLEEPSRQLLTIAMPMLGTGEGRLGYEIMEPIFFEYLDSLDNVIHLSMMPDKMDHIPKYLAIIGPRGYNNRDDVELGITTALNIWGLDWKDFDAIVSGGAKGVDSIACGIDRSDITYQNSLAKQYSNTLPIICKANWSRFGNSAGMLRNRTVINIATHIVAILPAGIPSVGTSGAIAHLRNVNTKLPEDQHKLLYIHGEYGQLQPTIVNQLVSPV